MPAIVLHTICWAGAMTIAWAYVMWRNWKL